LPKPQEASRITREMQPVAHPFDGRDVRLETERLRALVGSLGVGVLVEDEDRRISLANTAFCTIFGVSLAPHELLGADCAQAAEQAGRLMRDPVSFHARIQELLAAGVSVAGDEILFCDGRIIERDYEPISVDSVRRGHVWVYRDVTRARLDAEMRHAAQVRDQLRLAIDTIPGLVWSAQSDGHIDFLNQRWCDYTGLSMEQASGWGWEQAVHADDRAGLLRYWRSLLATGQAGEYEARLRRHDGSYRWFLFRGIPLHDASGRLVKWYGTNTDVDDRRRAEALLSGEKHLLELLARGGSLRDVLDGVCRLLEQSVPGCMCGILLVDAANATLVHGAAPNLPVDYARSIDGMPLSAAEGPCGMAAATGRQVIVSDVPADPRWRDRRWHTLARRDGIGACCSTPIVSLEGRVLGTFGIYKREPGPPSPPQTELIERFTHMASLAIERKRAEEALARAQAELAHVTRVTTLGELAGSIAHEVNQPLAAMIADAGACLNWLASEPPDLRSVGESLVAIASDGKRAGDVLTRIRALLARSAVTHTPCDLGAVLTAILPLARTELARHAIELRTELCLDGLRVLGDAVEIQQVLLNLLLNASEASKAFEPARRHVLLRASRELQGDRTWARISVEDRGTGIDESDLPRLFEAFYTKKPSGLGMGLSISRSIVDRHGGRLWAHNNPGPGATFCFALPEAAQRA
jgi:PAS domain S-box-containing protein